MPLENSGNMLFMLLSITQQQQAQAQAQQQQQGVGVGVDVDASWIQPYFPMLATWADELVRTTE